MWWCFNFIFDGYLLCTHSLIESIVWYWNANISFPLPSLYLDRHLLYAYSLRHGLHIVVLNVMPAAKSPHTQTSYSNHFYYHHCHPPHIFLSKWNTYNCDVSIWQNFTIDSQSDISPL